LCLTFELESSFELSDARSYYIDIEQGATASSYLGQGRFKSEGLTIGPVMHHRFDDVGHRDNSGRHSNLVAAQSMGIARSVQTFMVLKSYFDNYFGQRGFLQDVRTHFTVTLDQFELQRT
jgi:hypothetical protein